MPEVLAEANDEECHETTTIINITREKSGKEIAAPSHSRLRFPLRNIKRELVPNLSQLSYLGGTFLPESIRKWLHTHIFLALDDPLKKDEQSKYKEERSKEVYDTSFLS